MEIFKQKAVFDNRSTGINNTEPMEVVIIKKTKTQEERIKKQENKEKYYDKKENERQRVS